MKKLTRITSLLVLAFTWFILWSCDRLQSPDPTSAGRFELTKFIDGYQRKAILHVPDQYEIDSEIPLLVFLHGFAGSGEQAEADYHMLDKASKEGFALLFLEGISSDGPLGLKSWNAGLCCEYASENEIDDVKYVKEFIAEIENDWPGLGTKGRFVTGISNGAMMSYRLMIDLPGYFKAVAAVSGPLMITDFQISKTFPILHIHSMNDTKVPFEGGVGIGGVNFLPSQNGIELLMEKGACKIGGLDEKDRGTYIEKSGRCTEGQDIKILLTKDGGHSWPGGIKARPAADEPSKAFIANDVIWDFFKPYVDS